MTSGKNTPMWIRSPTFGRTAASGKRFVTGKLRLVAAVDRHGPVTRYATARIATKLSRSVVMISFTPTYARGTAARSAQRRAGDDRG